jgi:hypothetical protein
MPTPLTRRIFVGKDVVVVGVAGSTFTDEWGDLDSLCWWCECEDMETAGEAMLVELVDEAFECECWWW